jgi:opacity protein-like surface antigen
MKNYFRLWALLGGFLLTTQFSFAQMRGFELGGWGGVSNYFGDLNTNWRVNRVHLSGGVGARYNFNDRLALKLGANYGKISAYDSDSDNAFEQRRNLSFESVVVDGTAQFEFNFMPYVHGHRDYFFSPYLFAGVSMFYFNPRAEYEGEWYNLVEQGTEGQFRGEEYNTTQGALAYGFGLKMDLSYRWSMNVELSGRRLFTDYIDDVSGTYADVRDIRAQRGEIAAELSDRSEEPKIGEPGRQRGNGKNSDMYALLNIGFYYYFGDIRCPEFLR